MNIYENWWTSVKNNGMYWFWTWDFLLSQSHVYKGKDTNGLSNTCKQSCLRLHDHRWLKNELSHQVQHELTQDVEDPPSSWSSSVCEFLPILCSHLTSIQIPLSPLSLPPIHSNPASIQHPGIQDSRFRPPESEILILGGSNPLRTGGIGDFRMPQGITGCLTFSPQKI